MGMCYSSRRMSPRLLSLSPLRAAEPISIHTNGMRVSVDGDSPNEITPTHKRGTTAVRSVNISYTEVGVDAAFPIAEHKACALCNSKRSVPNKNQHNILGTGIK